MNEKLDRKVSPRLSGRWPDHFLIMIQMLIPAGVVDCLLTLVNNHAP